MKGIDNWNAVHTQRKRTALCHLLIVVYLAVTTTFSPVIADPPKPVPALTGPTVAHSSPADQTRSLLSSQRTPATWRDTFDDGSGLDVRKNTQVHQGALTLGLDNIWVQTTQEDFEAGIVDGRLDTTSVPGALQLATTIMFTTGVRVNDDTGSVDQRSPGIAVEENGSVYAVWHDYRNGDYDIYFSHSTDGGNTWSPNVRVNDDIGSVYQDSPAITVDRDGNVYAVWEDGRNGDLDIYFSRSTDGGVTWSPNVRVNDDNGSAYQWNPAIAIDGDGNVYTIWQDERNGDYDIYFSRSTDGGITWSPNVRVDDAIGAARQYSPVIAVDGDGKVYAVWYDGRNGDYDIYFSRSTDGGITWSSNVRVDDDTGLAWQRCPAIAVDGDGNAYVAWHDQRNGGYDDIYFSRSTDGGVTWSPSERINDDIGAATQFRPVVVADEDNNVYAVWVDYRNGDIDIYFSHSTDKGRTWSPNVRVNDDTGSAYQWDPTIAVDGDGNVYTMWQDERNGDQDIYFARSLSGTTYFRAGTWTSTVYDAGGVAAWADIAWTATIPANTAITFQTRTGDTPTPDHTWSDWSRTYTVPKEAIEGNPARYVQCRTTLSTSNVHATPILLEVQVHYRPHPWIQTTQADFESGSVERLDITSIPGDVALDQAPAFAASVKINDDAGSALQWNPAIALGGDSDVYAVWNDSRNDNYDVYCSRSIDGGVTWSSNVRVNDDIGFVSAWSNPAIVTDGDSNAYAAWTDVRSGGRDIYFSRSIDGGVTWSPNVRINDNEAADQLHSAIAVDGDGNVYAAWEDERNGRYDIYFSRSTDGGVTWSPNVRVNDVGAAYQGYPAIAVDEGGNAYAVWEDSRFDNYDIYFSRSTDGGVTWSPNVRVDDAAGSPSLFPYPAIVVNANGHAHVVWEDERNGEDNDDIYYSRSTDGGVTWSPNVRVNDDHESANQGPPSVAVGGGGRVYAVWGDSRDGNGDIYLSRSADDGVNWSYNVRVDDDSGAESQGSPSIAVDEDDNVYVVWCDGRGDSGDIYFSRSLPGITHYADIGVLASSVYDTGGVVAWGQITWTATTPPSTTIAFQTRTGDTATPDEDWSQWSTVYASPGLTVTSPLSRYIQYQAVLSTTDPYTTPVLHDVTLDWKQFAPAGSATSVPIAPPPGFLRWDNLYFAADVPGNTSLTVDVLSITGTVLITSLSSGGNLHSIDPVAHPAIRLRANLVRSTDPTQTPRLDEWMVTWTPPPPEQHVRVFDEQGIPIEGARIYQNGGFVGSTDDLGVLGFDPPANTLSIGDKLVALALVEEHPSSRGAHQTADGAQDWAFRTYVTNVEVGDEGAIYTHVVTQTGRQLLAVKASNPLFLFNLVISIEWDATDGYTDEIARAIQNASDYLYDLTDGQMVFGWVTIYDEGTNWADADIQISTKNIVRPHAYISGITSDDKSHVIRVGRGWDGNSGNQGAWDWPDGYRTLAHEFGHYALHLYDEYFGYLFDQNDNLVSEVSAYCTGPENRSPATDATNASAMDYQYTTSELSARGVPGMWSALCEETAQWQLNGESAWETVVRMYADAQSPARWQLTTPLDRGRVLTGPIPLPADVLALPTITISNTGASGPPKLLTVYGPDGEPYRGAIVALYKQDGRVVGQGFTDGNGRLDIYGAEEGDTVRAASMDGGLAGKVMVGAGTYITLTLSPVSGLAAQAVGRIPHMRVVAEPGPNPDRVDLSVLLHGFGPGADPSVIVTEPGSEVGHAPTLSYSPTTDTYEGQICFSAIERGMGRIRAMGAVGDSLVRLQSTYRLQRVVNDLAHDVYSDDGNLSLHLGAGSLPGSEAYVVVMPPGALPGPLPEGLVLVGDAYDVTASGALVTLERPAVLKLRYDGALVNSSLTPEGMGIYRWNPNSEIWQAVSGTMDEEQKAVAAAVTALGTYALLALPGPWMEPLRETIFLPVVFKGVP